MSNNAPFAYEGLDRTIHERARLAILTSLIAMNGPVSFHDLKKACGLTDGNLSRHLQVLQEAGLIEIDKQFEGVRPLTTVFLTEDGRRRFLDYLEILEQVVKDAAHAAKNTKNVRPSSLKSVPPKKGFLSKKAPV